MTQIRPIPFATISFGLLLGLTAVPGHSSYAQTQTAPTSNQPTSNQTTSAPNASAAETVGHERDADQDIGRARYASQHHEQKELIDYIERAETALLNVSQVNRDPHVDAALQHLQAVRDAANRNDLHTAGLELAQATRDVNVALAAAGGANTASAGGASTADASGANTMVPMNGESVYNSDSDKVGAVTDVVYDQNGQPIAIIIDVGPYLGSGDKNVAVPPSDVTKSADHTTINRSKQQLSQAPNTPPPDYSSTQQ